MNSDPGLGWAWNTTFIHLPMPPPHTHTWCYSSAQWWHHPCRYPLILSSNWIWQSQVLLCSTHSANMAHPVYHRAPAPCWKGLVTLCMEMGGNSLSCPVPTWVSSLQIVCKPSGPHGLPWPLELINFLAYPDPSCALIWHHCLFFSP